MKMNFAKRLFWVSPFVAGLVVWGCYGRSANADFTLKNEDRIVFFGDSITQFQNYTRPVQDYIYSRYPNLHVHFFNAGWAGDVTGGALNRLDRDVLSLKPTVVTICFGMNDGRYTSLNDEILNTYRTNLDAIVKQLTDKGIRVVVFSPPPVDYDRNPKFKEVDYNKNLEALAGAADEVAKKYNCTYHDILHPILATETALKANNPAFTMIPDGIHPDETGGIVMGGEILKGLGVQPMPALATLDANAGSKAGDTYTFKVSTPVNVPLWMSSDGVQAARQSGFLALAGQKLSIANLPGGVYDVQVDGVSVGEWNQDDLAAGVQVAGAFSKQAQHLYDMTNWKEQNYYNAWRVLKLGDLQGPAVDGAVAGMMKADEALQSSVESLSAPYSGATITVQSTGLPAGLGANLALHKSYVTSDPNTHNFGIGALTDGSWDSNGHTFATNEKDAFPKTATIDLGQAASVSHVFLEVPPFGATKTITVALSTDGQKFTDVGSYVFSEKKEEKHLYAFAATPARYVRLTYPDHYDDFIGYDPKFSFTSEVEVYGPK